MYVWPVLGIINLSACFALLFFLCVLFLLLAFCALFRTYITLMRQVLCFILVIVDAPSVYIGRTNVHD